MSILIVDDEPDVAVLVRQKFRRQIASGEMQITFARNGEEALQVLAAEPSIELIVTDINMPVMDGLTLLGRIAARSGSRKPSLFRRTTIWRISASP